MIPGVGSGREWIGFALATSSSNRCVAILAISISAVACSWVGELFSRSQPFCSTWSKDVWSRTAVTSGKPNRSR